MPQHKDQVRIQEVFLPHLAERLLDESPEAQRDCTVVNRLFIQGPDPLFLMEVAPDQFNSLCHTLRLDPEVGRQGIENAHWMGPACLLDGSGIPYDYDGDGSDLTEKQRQEALWLILAAVSDCMEDGYQKDVSLVVRMQRAVRATIRLDATIQADMNGFESIIEAAIYSMIQFRDTTTWRFDERGIPHSNQDHAFYIGYKTGYKIVAVTAPSGLVFFGTPPSTTLAEQGVIVDKMISPSFGLVFPPKAD